VILALLLACRPIPGGDDYSSQEDLSWLTDDEVLMGADPWEPGEPRLTVGLFYEGGASHAVPIDNLKVFYYVYEGTYFQDDSDDRVEGEHADRIIHAGGGWFGGGIHFEDGPRDFSVWSTLHVSMKSSAASMEALQLGTTTVDGEFSTPLTEWGFASDGAWHTIEIDMASVATGIEATSVPLSFIGGAGTTGDALLVDDLYWTP
jgi:hypothetical protein